MTTKKKHSHVEAFQFLGKTLDKQFVVTVDANYQLGVQYSKDISTTGLMHCTHAAQYAEQNKTAEAIEYTEPRYTVQ